MIYGFYDIEIQLNNNSDMNNLNELTPASVWSYFEAICRIPRPSKREGKIIDIAVWHFYRFGNWVVIRQVD
jgi:hypothetical protein